MSRSLGLSTLRKIVQRMSGAVFATDPEGRIVVWSQGARALLGWEVREVVGRSCWEMLAGLDRHGNPYCVPECPILQTCRRGVTPRPHELYLTSAGGSRRAFTCAVTTVSTRQPHRPFVIYQLFPGGESPEPPAPRESLGQPPGGSSPAIGRKDAPVRAVRADVANLDRLTRRETEVLRALAQGRSAGEIARALSISELTVRNHIQSILRKLEVHSKLEAVVLAYRANLGE